MAPEADVCLVVDGGYPHILGGVANDGRATIAPALRCAYGTIADRRFIP